MIQSKVLITMLKMDEYGRYGSDSVEFILRHKHQGISAEDIARANKISAESVRAIWGTGLLVECAPSIRVFNKLSNPVISNFSWQISFGKTVDSESVSDETVFVTDEVKSEKVDCNLSTSECRKKIIVTPHLPFKYNTLYILHRLGQVRVGGKPLVRDVKIKFLLAQGTQDGEAHFVREVLTPRELSIVDEFRPGDELVFEHQQKSQAIEEPKIPLLGKAKIAHSYDWKVVLRWQGRCETDLDLHGILYDENNIHLSHIYFGNKNYMKDNNHGNQVWLDFDFRTHPGWLDWFQRSEVLTILGQPAKAIKIKVVNFNGGKLTRNFCVDVYSKEDNKDKLLRRFEVKSDILNEKMQGEHLACILDLEQGLIKQFSDYC